MTKKEFLDELRSHLIGRVDDRELQSQLNYYDSYITGELNSGKTMDEVINQIGSPQLIAKTILQAYSVKTDPISRQYNKEESYSGTDEYNEYDTRNDRDNLWKIIPVIMLIFFAVLIIGFVFKLIILLIPVLIFCLAIYILIKILKS